MAVKYTPPAKAHQTMTFNVVLSVSSDTQKFIAGIVDKLLETQANIDALAKLKAKIDLIDPTPQTHKES